MVNKQLSLALLVTGLITPAIAFAATEQRLPGVIDRTIPEIEIPEKFDPENKQQGPLKEAPKLEKGMDDKNIVTTIKHIDFSGNTVISDDELMEVAEDYVNRPLTKMDLAKLKYQLARAFYDKGYILVRVVTPPQDLSNGTLKVEIYEAKVGEVSVKEQDAVLPWLANQMAKRAQTGDIFSEQDAETLVSDMNDLKGVDTTLNLSPGKSFNTTDLLLALSKTEEDEQVVTIDNYGSPLTGEVVASIHLEKSNILGMGETFYTNLRRSHDSLWSVKVGNVLPLGFFNTNLELDYLHSENDIGDRLANLSASGETDILGIALSRNILNMRNRKVTVRTGLEVRQHKSFLTNIIDTKDEITEWFAEGSYLARTDNAVYYAQTRVSTGADLLSAHDEGHLLATNALGDPDAWRVAPLFYANILSPVSDGSFSLSASGQLSSGELLSSDLFILGGYGSVRGFDPAQLTGESGYQFSLEYNHNLPQLVDTWDWSIGPFVDGGVVFNRVNSGLVDYNRLYSIGVGLEADADLIDAGTTTVRLDWAHPLGGYDQEIAAGPGAGTVVHDSTVSSNTFYFRVSQAF